MHHPSKIYVRANSKAELKRAHNNGIYIIGTEFNAFNPNGYKTFHYLNQLKKNTVIAIYTDFVDDSPYSHSWGTYNPETNSIV